jgi:hypothetical protein
MVPILLSSISRSSCRERSPAPSCRAAHLAWSCWLLGPGTKEAPLVCFAWHHGWRPQQRGRQLGLLARWCCAGPGHHVGGGAPFALLRHLCCGPGRDGQGHSPQPCSRAAERRSRHAATGCSVLEHEELIPQVAGPGGAGCFRRGLSQRQECPLGSPPP